MKLGVGGVGEEGGFAGRHEVYYLTVLFFFVFSKSLFSQNVNTL
jgi:hypothetical protein